MFVNHFSAKLLRAGEEFFQVEGPTFQREFDEALSYGGVDSVGNEVAVGYDIPDLGKGEARCMAVAARVCAVFMESIMLRFDGGRGIDMAFLSRRFLSVDATLFAGLGRCWSI